MPSTPVLDRLRTVERVLAVATALLFVVYFRTPPGTVPGWADLGALSLPLPALYPVPLALVTVAVALRATGTDLPRRILTVLAAVVLVTAAIAVISLNTTSGGVFFAGFPPVLFGALLAVGVIIDGAVDVGRRLIR
jgi:hypothetical protein